VGTIGPTGSANPVKPSPDGQEGSGLGFVDEQAQGEDGAMGFLDRVGDALSDRMETMFSADNMDRILTDLDKALPGLKDFLKNMFNSVSGSQSADNDLTNKNDTLASAVFGTADPEDDDVR